MLQLLLIHGEVLTHLVLVKLLIYQETILQVSACEVFLLGAAVCKVFLLLTLTSLTTRMSLAAYTMEVHLCLSSSFTLAVQLITS
jgi:hypothetical protein